MIIRTATLADAAAIREIYNHEVENTTATMDLVPRSLADQEQWISDRSGAFATIVAEVAMLVQVLVGVILVASDQYEAPRFHMFYGFVIFITVGLLYQYRGSMKGRLEMLYGFGGLFVMGLGIRAVLQVAT